MLSTDELTGVQALERAHPGLPLAPGKVEGREFASIRHGTTSFILNRDVVSRQIVAPSCGPTRTAADFRDHVAQTVATDPTTTRWHFVMNNLTIHTSTLLARYVVDLCGCTEDLGILGKQGIRRTRHTRATFLADVSHRVVSHDTPKHASPDEPA